MVEVALPVPVHALFDYRVPLALAADAEPGRRVRVPFGTRRLVGVIVSRRSEPGRERSLRALERVLDPEPVLSASMMRILRDAAEDVLCPPGLALAAATPPGSVPRARAGLALTPLGREALARGAAEPRSRRVLEALADGPRSRHALRRLGPQATRALRTLERERLVATVTLEDQPRTRAPSVRVVVPAARPALQAALAGPLARAPRQAELVRHLADAGETPLPALRERFPGATARVRALAERGLLRVEERAPARPPVAPAEAEPRLTPEQEAALAAVLEVAEQRRFEALLLHGVTGSGKTEVYLRALARVLEQGRQALVLVPEIGLTHQLVARLRARFGDRLAVLHSGLRPGERLAEWRRLRAGEAPIAVGARSALFAPLENLGLVVMDEEHDASYKNQEGFRYHARDLAARRARAAGCPLVMGTATPSLETRFAAERGAMRRLVLPHRIGGRPLPAVEIVDLAAERALLPRGRKLVLSRALRVALGATLAEGGQAILFLNRRGFSTRIFCFDCGHAERCKHCDISLVFHATEQELRCHYCDFTVPPPELCSGCGAGPTALLGIGTERLEEEVRTLFPEARIARLDRDTASRRGRAERTLADLAAGRLDVLVGTQMVALGHDFPGVRLVGVVAADLGLHLPDFRAAERTFQLLTQAAGRAGRGHAPGRVIVQTFVPDHYAIRTVREHDYETFYREEMAQRGALGYPPLGTLVHVLISGPDVERTESVARRLADQARRVLEPEAKDQAGASPDVEILGPGPAPIARLRDRHRFQLLLKGRDDTRVRAAARAIAREAPSGPRDVRVQVDPNPVHML